MIEFVIAFSQSIKQSFFRGGGGVGGCGGRGAAIMIMRSIFTQASVELH